MQDQSIGFDHFDRLQALLDAIAIIELYRAQVGKQQDIRGLLAHPKSNRLLWMLYGGALRPHSHCHACRLGSQSQSPVDRRRFLCAPGHGRNQHRRLQRSPKQLQAQIHIFQVNFWQRPVDKMVLLQPRGQARTHIFLQVDADVVCLSRNDLRNFCHKWVFLW